MFDEFKMTDAYTKLLERGASEEEIQAAYRSWCYRQMQASPDYE